MSAEDDDISTMDALNNLATSIPDWQARLDELNGQIAQRQIELAQLTESQRPPPARSLRNRGSTESLRQRDREVSPELAVDDEHSSSPLERRSHDAPGNLLPSGAVVGADVLPSSATRPIELNGSSSLPTTPQRTISNPLHPRLVGMGAKKRKTESIISSESHVPKYRTRSMIIVYYDSAVQAAFESLVKFVSASRNSIRKAKMAARMLELKRIAELEAANDSGDDDDDDGLPMGEVPSAPLQSNQLGFKTVRSTQLEIDENYDRPIKLEFKSTRSMGPTRDQAELRPTRVQASDITYSGSGGLLGDSSMGSVMDVYKELEKDLQWVQGMCETAAHQFLRDGECDGEIAAIKKRLSIVKTLCEKEVTRMTVTVQETKDGEQVLGMLDKSNMEGRELRSIQLRKSPSPAKTMPPLDLEVDDSGIEDTPQLTFVSARDRARQLR